MSWTKIPIFASTKLLPKKFIISLLIFAYIKTFLTSENTFLSFCYFSECIFGIAACAFTFSHSHHTEPRLFPSTQLKRRTMMWIHSYITFLCFLVLFCFYSTLSPDRQRQLINPCARRCPCEWCMWIWGMRQLGYVSELTRKGKMFFLRFLCT